MNNKGIMEQKNKLIPELRFPEFVKDGEWENDKFENLILTITPPKKLNSSEYKKEGKFPIVDQSQSFYCGRTNEEDALINKKKSLIIFGDHTCIVKIINEPFAQGADGIKILEAKENINPIFLAQYLYFNPVKQEEYKRHFSILKDKIVYFPNHKTQEQQKIADCLSSLDELITTHNDKLETLKNHKKGLLQNLFPQEGQKVPNYRFPEFVNDGEWESKTVKDVAYYENGKAHEQDILDNGKYKVVNSKFISTEGKVVKYSNKAHCLAEKNDVLMVLSDVPNGRAIAKCFFVNENNLYTVNQRVCKLKSFDINSKFLYILLNRNKYFLAFDDGVKQTNLKNDDVLNCPILLPKKTKDNKEQQKIADCLMAVDNLIAAQTEKIEQLKTHKKGLMQGLFPKIEE